MALARCISPAWDNDATVKYEPGYGPERDGLYEIDPKGPLAQLKVGGKNVFEFVKEAATQAA